ncbi:d-erythrulose reductase [Holotrichia oblita]|uniref:D-erythrulose reductase n=1 Tax=Holotrichia oblita TaxID=644536 RepID=A0ACB9SLU3_HOLOL|nr:d-erythrulose reductase [Holotrichia oblita]
MEASFKNKTALVIGASQGIGREIAKQLASYGAKVIAVSRSKDRLGTLQQEVPSMQVIPLDVTNWNETEKVLSGLGPIDFLVNNAGPGVFETVLDTTEQQLDFTFGINVKSLINTTRVIAKNFLQHKTPGVIVNLSSSVSMAAASNLSAYIAAKGAVDAYTRACALELGPHNIRVNCVNATIILTETDQLGYDDPSKANPLYEITPLKRFCKIQEVVDVTLYLLSNQSSMITGVCLPVDGGFLAT